MKEKLATKRKRLSNKKMKKLISLFLLSKKLFERKGYQTFYQVKLGNKKEWISLEQFQSDYKEKQITKILMGANYYGTSKSNYEIRATAILPFSNQQSTKK
jgi:hypothetical protein